MPLPLGELGPFLAIPDVAGDLKRQQDAIAAVGRMTMPDVTGDLRRHQDAIDAIGRITIPDVAEELKRRQDVIDRVVSGTSFNESVRLMAEAGKLPGLPASNAVHLAPAVTPPERKPSGPLGPAKEFRLLRDGARDLVFAGWQLGTGSVVGGKFDPSIGPDGGEYERDTTVTIYLTESGNFVIHEHRSKNYGDQQNDDVTVIARAGGANTIVDLQSKPRKESDVSAEERLLLVLRHMGMGQASRDAWNEACKAHSALRSLEVERLD